MNATNRTYQMTRIISAIAYLLVLLLINNALEKIFVMSVGALLGMLLITGTKIRSTTTPKELAALIGGVGTLGLILLAELIRNSLS